MQKCFMRLLGLQCFELCASHRERRQVAHQPVPVKGAQLLLQLMEPPHLQTQPLHLAALPLPSPPSHTPLPCPQDGELLLGRTMEHQCRPLSPGSPIPLPSWSRLLAWCCPLGWCHLLGVTDKVCPCSHPCRFSHQCTEGFHLSQGSLLVQPREPCHSRRMLWQQQLHHR